MISFYIWSNLIIIMISLGIIDVKAGFLAEANYEIISIQEVPT